MNIRDKGHGGEREIAALLNGIKSDYGLDMDVRRNLDQTAIGGRDLVNTEPFSIEIKRQEVLNLNAWWKQACASAEKDGLIPIVIFRQNRKPWQVLCHGQIGDIVVEKVQISIREFLNWYRSELEKRIKK
jgi:hypothetical protein